MSQRFCPKCGEEIVQGKAFCPNCGTRLEASAEQTYEKETVASGIANQDNKKKKRRIAIVCSVLAIIVVIIIIASQQNDSYVPDYTPSTKTTNTNTQVSTASAYCKISGVKVTHKGNYAYVTGTIKNTSSTTKYRYIKVKASCKNSSGKVIDTDWCYAVDSAWLEPGESKSFEMMIKDENNQIRSATVAIMPD